MKKIIQFFLCATVMLSLSRPVEAQIKIDSVQTGIASYYGPGFDGRYCASGEIFHKDSMTAASKNLPFNTWLRVTNLSNDSVVIVKVNDRMPLSNPRLIDLAEGAAKKLDMIKNGTTKVRIEIITNPFLVYSKEIIPEQKPDSTKTTEHVDTIKKDND